MLIFLTFILVYQLLYTLHFGIIRTSSSSSLSLQYILNKTLFVHNHSRLGIAQASLALRSA